MANLINHTQKWAFLHIPKTGGVSITDVLYQQPNTEYVLESNHHSSIKYFPEMESYFVFTTLRNPFYRFLSGYYHHQRPEGNNEWNYIRDYKSFVNDVVMNNTLVSETMNYLITNGESNSKKVNHFIKFENLKNEFNFILKTLNINSKIYHFNKNHVSSKYILNYEIYNSIYKENPWLIDFVVNYYKVDFETYDYDKKI